MSTEGKAKEPKILQEGQLVCHGNYVLQRLLRDDVTGQVWLASRKGEPGEVRELRFLPAALGEQPAERPYLRSIVSKLVDLQHPGVAHVYGYIRENSDDIICQEWVEAPSLMDLAFDQPGRVFNEEAVMAWLPQVLDALEYSHTQSGLAHGHLKPQNILLKGGKTKIIEFQLGRVLRDILVPVERQGGRKGAMLAHASPERVAGKDIGAAEDIYSLGAVLYDLLAGEPPHGKSGEVATPAPLQDRRKAHAPDSPAVSAGLAAAVNSCLAPTQKDRPGTIGELRAKLGLPAPAPVPASQPTPETGKSAQLELFSGSSSQGAQEEHPPKPATGAQQTTELKARKGKDVPKADTEPKPTPEKEPKPKAALPVPEVEVANRRSPALAIFVVLALLSAGGYGGWVWWSQQQAGETTAQAPADRAQPEQAAPIPAAAQVQVPQPAASSAVPEQKVLGTPITAEELRLADVRREEIRTLLRTATEALQRGSFEESLVAYSTVVSLTREYLGEPSQTTAPTAGANLTKDEQFVQEMRNNAAFAWHGRGECHFEQGMYSDALREFSEAMKINVANDQTLARVAQCQLELRENAAAKASLDKALELNSSQANAVLALGRYQVSVEKDYAGGIATLDRAITLRPELVEALYWKAKAVGAMRDTAAERELLARCEAGFTQILEHRPLAARWLAFRGSTRLWLGNFQAAADDFSEVARMLPNYGFAYSNRGFAYLRLGQLQKAISDLDEAVRLDPALPSNFINRGDAYLRLNRPEQAAENYTQALTLEAGNPVGWHNRAMALLRLNRYQSALADFDKALSLDPNASVVYLNKANAQYAAEEYPAAIRTYTEVLARDSGNAQAYRDRGSARFAIGEYAEAIQDFNKAVELRPNDALSYFRRGAALDSNGEFEKAIQDFTKAIELNAKDPRYFKARADAYATMGQMDKANEDFRKGELLERETGVMTQASYGPL